MPLTLASDLANRVCVDLQGVAPDALRNSSLAAVQRRTVRHGNRNVELGELFRVDGDPRDMSWRLQGDFSACRYLGAGMTAGDILIDGSAGRHAAAGMRGGHLEIRGHAGDYLAAEMRGGTIRVYGNAGDHVGAAYRGSRRGMSGGSIIIYGDVGNELGQRMRLGMIAVGGSAGSYVGMRMLAGSIFVFGDCGEHPGAGMRRGTIGLFGQQRPALLPTFRAGYRGPLPVLHLIEKQLHAAGFDAPRLRNLAASIELFHGDLLELGRGEILLPA